MDILLGGVFIFEVKKFELKVLFLSITRNINNVALGMSYSLVSPSLKSERTLLAYIIELR